MWEFKIDTGADLTVVPEKEYDKTRDGPLTPQDRILCGPGQHTLKVSGNFFPGRLRNGNTETREQIYVVQGPHRALLRRPAIESLNPVVQVEPVLTQKDAIVQNILPSVEQIIAQSKDLNANSRFRQIALTKNSALLTTSITPFGRFCLHHLPFEITSAPEHFQRRMSEILQGLDGVVCLIDDILVYGKDQEEHDTHLTAVNGTNWSCRPHPQPGQVQVCTAKDQISGASPWGGRDPT